MNKMRPGLGLTNLGWPGGTFGSVGETFSGKSEGNFSIILSSE
jgi:hypothetical protein